MTTRGLKFEAAERNRQYRDLNPPRLAHAADQATSLTTSRLAGIAGIILDVHAGFDMIPGKLGSTVRERGPVDDFQSGVKEGGKGLWYGWWDGITGLATEPIEGGKKEVTFYPRRYDVSDARIGSFGSIEGNGPEL